MIRFPHTRKEIEDAINGFLIKCGYPMCLGALDGSHINIKPPLGSETDYYNYKKFYSVILLAMVNSDLAFTYVNIGAPGRCNDSSVYSRSTLPDVIKNSVYEDYYTMINGVKVRSHMVADSAFALDKTVIKPFPEHPDMSRQERVFNYRLSIGRSSIERAFGMLKNRFRLLHKRMEFDLNNSINIIKAAAILHNLCVLSGDSCEAE